MRKKKIGVRTIVTGIMAMSLGLNAQVSENLTSNTGTHSSAIGSNCTSLGPYSIAGGYLSTTGASGSASIALGEECNSTGERSVSMGWRSSANGRAAVGIGYRANASAQYAMSLGSWADATNTNSLAIGTNLRAVGDRSFVIGTGVSSGSRLENTTSNSLMVGFGSTKPTLFVKAANSGTEAGEVRIGGLASVATFDGFGKLQVVDQSTGWNAFIFNGGGDGKGLRIKGGFYNNAQALFQVESNNSSSSPSLAEENIRFSVKADGRVIVGDPAIATVSSALGTQINRDDYRLFVENGILAERVKVALMNSTDWADYVFEDGYELKKLEEVESFINENGHLPDVPSAEQVAAEGIDVAEMNALLLQKIEELTLYVIDLEKKYKELEARDQSTK